MNCEIKNEREIEINHSQEINNNQGEIYVYKDGKEYTLTMRMICKELLGQLSESQRN